MSYRKFLIASGFVLILLGLGTADYFITKGTLRFPPQEGVAKQAGPEARAVALSRGFTIAETTEQNILPPLLSPEVRARFSAAVLLKDDDRAATMGWIDSPQVK